MSAHVCTAGVPKKIYKDARRQRKGELLVVNGEGESAIEQQRCRTKKLKVVTVWVCVCSCALAWEQCSKGTACWWCSSGTLEYLRTWQFPTALPDFRLSSSSLWVRYTTTACGGINVALDS